MAYTRVNWQDAPLETTPRNAENLNKMDKGIADLETNFSIGLWVQINEVSFDSFNQNNRTAIYQINDTNNFRVGLRIKIIQNNNKIYGIITKVSSNNIYVLIAKGSVVTNASFEINYSIYDTIDFPIDKNLWTIDYIFSTVARTDNPTANTWYNGFTLQNVPVGEWKVEINTFPVFGRNTIGFGSCFVCMSETNNTSSINNLISGFYQYISANANGSYGKGCFLSNILKVEESKNYYLNIRTTDSGVSDIRLNTNIGGSMVKMICEYL